MPSRLVLFFVLFVMLGGSAAAAPARPFSAVSLELAEEADGAAVLQRRQDTLGKLWAFASLNYLYCDVVGLMDANMLRQYQTGTVGDFEMSENFLLGATVMMQVPLSMVFLSSALNPRASRIANVSAGLFMTSVQTATLFVGRPTRYYLASSIIEIGTTAFITAYAWRKLKAPVLSPVVGRHEDATTVGLRVAF